MKRAYKWCGEKGTLFCTYLTFWHNIINYWLSESVFFTTNNLTDAKKYFSNAKCIKSRSTLLFETAQTTRLRRAHLWSQSHFFLEKWDQDQNRVLCLHHPYDSSSSKKNNSCLHGLNFLAVPKGRLLWQPLWYGIKCKTFGCVFFFTVLVKSSFC